MDERGASTDFQQDRQWWGDEHGGPRTAYDSLLEGDSAQRVDRLLWPMLLTAALIGFVAGVYLGATIPTVWR
jgi:hypothetical protein